LFRLIEKKKNYFRQTGTFLLFLFSLRLCKTLQQSSIICEKEIWYLAWSCIVYLAWP